MNFIRFVICQGSKGKYRVGLQKDGKFEFFCCNPRGWETPQEAAQAADEIATAFREGRYEGIYTESGYAWQL